MSNKPTAPKIGGARQDLIVALELLTLVSQARRTRNPRLHVAFEELELVVGDAAESATAVYLAALAANQEEPP